MVVWRTQNTPRWQQFHVAPAMPVLQVHRLGACYSKTRYEKLVTHVEAHASAVSLLESEEYRYIKAINITRTIGQKTSVDNAQRIVTDQAEPLC